MILYTDVYVVKTAQRLAICCCKWLQTFMEDLLEKEKQTHNPIKDY